VIDVSKLSGDTIKFGATVTMTDEDTDERQIWQIVGEPEVERFQSLRRLPARSSATPKARL
jgi:transcription elongation GreA/GreB family factor